MSVQPRRLLVRSAVGVLAVSLSALGTSVAAEPSASATTVSQTAGSLNTAFNNTGVITQATPSTDSSVAIVPTDLNGSGAPIDNSGDVVVAENNDSASPTSEVYEYSPTGALVATSSTISSFKALGVAVVPPTLSTVDAGDIVVAGWTNSSSVCSGIQGRAAAIEVLTPALVAIGPLGVDCTQPGQFSAVAVDSSGLPVAAGFIGTTTFSALVARFAITGTTSGSIGLDSTFGSAGFTTTTFTSENVQVEGVTVTDPTANSDRIYLTGLAQFANIYDPFAAVLGPTGAPVDTFGPGYTTNSAPGIVYVSGDGTGVGNGIAVLSDGNVAIAGFIVGSDGDENALFEWDPNGTVVPGFGTNGASIQTPNVSSVSAWQGLAYNPTGDFLTAVGFAGTGTNGAPDELVVSQFCADPYSSSNTTCPAGSQLNPNYGTSGTAVESPSSYTNELDGVAIAADGDAVVAGVTTPNAGNSPEGYVAEFLGVTVSVSVGSSLYTTSGTTQTVPITVTLSQALSTASSTQLCYTVSGGGQPSTTTCTTINFQACTSAPCPAGATTQTIQASITTAGVGQSETVTASTVDNGGVGGSTTSQPATTTVQQVPVTNYSGYWLVGATGAVFNFGTTYYGRVTNPSSPVVGIAGLPSGTGYWAVTAKGQVFHFGNAPAYQTTPLNPATPVVAIADDPAGTGFWMVTQNGAVYSYGSATFLGRPLANKPIVDIVATPDGKGYFLVTSNGAMYTYGSAKYLGGTNLYNPAPPIVAMASYPGGNGYWMISSNGGVFAYGNAPFEGAPYSYHPTQRMVGMAVDATGTGYWIISTGGGVLSFNAPFKGSLGGDKLAAPITGIAG